MAMTKKEKEYVEFLENEVRLRSALRWTEPVEEDLPAPKYGEADTSGWIYNTYNCLVEPGWSSTVYHGRGYASKSVGFSVSQKSISMHTTPLLALKAMRYEIEMECAKKLAKVDKMIETEISK